MIQVKDTVKERPEYVDILRRIVGYEENNPKPDHVFIEDKEYDCCWDYKDVGVSPNKLYKLETDGVLERVFDSNSTTAYALRDRDEVKSLVSELSGDYEDGVIKKRHSFPDPDEIKEMGVFEDVVGYEDAKWLLRKALSADDIVNILLVGPPGCGKTVFLRCIDRLEGARFISGKKTTSSGFADEMFDKKPRYMCIDELDDMSSKDQKALSDYSEEGVLVETKGNDKRRELHTNTKTFAASNSTNGIIDQIENRFTDLHFEPYSLDEFKEVCVNILPRDYGQTKENSREIAEAVWDIDGFANVRKAEDVASLSDGDDPKRVIRVLDKYSDDSLF